ncbi:MAG: hypothetical protein L3J88_13060 [Gammaproteobacteria bacterium]|nr:hypothetical protein [Gammaproteobacteria bacterium]MCF6364244.1 hypothetical protein [Gammaproteobacteria bacterium]
MQIGSSLSGLPPPQAGPRAATDTPPTNPAANDKTESSRAPATNQQLTEEQRAQVQALKSRDREVRAHEAAHMAAAGGLARGGASYSYETGPDNRRYAVGGEVSINTSPGNSPEETLQKAETIRAAAQAPAKPSQQDLAIAASAGKMAAEARAELAAQQFSGDDDDRSRTQARAVENYTQTSSTGTSEQKSVGINLIA